ncbi:T9SS C-terminal target domain-containing protein, partial [Pseudoxanthomonas sp. SGD-10]
SDFTITLTDLSGRSVAVFRDIAQSGNNTFDFSTGKLVPGVYVATYISDTEKASVKIVIE